MAQDNVRAWERTDNLKVFGTKVTTQQRASVEQLYLPDVTYALGATVYIGTNRGVTLRSMPGHSGGDSVVYDAEANEVFCSDLFWNQMLPNLIDASTDTWFDSLNTLLSTYPSAKFVPGLGAKVGDAADVRAFRDYLIFLRQAITKAQKGGASSDAVLKSGFASTDCKYSDWGFFDFAKPDIQRTDEELRGTKRLPPHPSR